MKRPLAYITAAWLSGDSENAEQAARYDTPGVSHCGIYVGDGRMLHCGDPIRYANLNTSYWQSHFYAYGRLP